MTKNNNIDKKEFDLEKRTLDFAGRVRKFIGKMRKNLINMEDCKQLLRSSGSVGANYIEANESLSRKDFLMRVKISRKEAKESLYWLKLLETQEDASLEEERGYLMREITELMLILGAIVRKVE